MELPKAPTQRLTHSPVAKDDNSLHGSKEKKQQKNKTKQKQNNKKTKLEFPYIYHKKTLYLYRFLKITILVFVIYCETLLETTKNTCSNNEFHEENQFFCFC